MGHGRLPATGRQSLASIALGLMVLCFLASILCGPASGHPPSNSAGVELHGEGNILAAGALEVSVRSSGHLYDGSERTLADILDPLIRKGVRREATIVTPSLTLEDGTPLPRLVITLLLAGQSPISWAWVMSRSHNG